MKLTRAFKHFLPISLALFGVGAIANAQLSIDEVGGFSFTYQLGASLPPDQFLHVNGSGLRFTVDQTQVPWITVYNTADRTVVVSNQTQVSPPVVLGLQVNPAASQLKTPGTYSGTLYINQIPTVGTGIPVPMTLTVLGPPTGSIIVSPTSLTFNYPMGGAVPLSQLLSITNTTGSVSFNLGFSTSNGLNWLSAFPSFSYTPSTVTVTATPLPGMGPGVYTGLVYVHVGTSIAQTVPVTLVIAAGGTLSASPTFLTFNYQTGGAAPAPQTVSVVNYLGGNVPYTVTASTSTGINWLAVSPASGTTPSSFSVSVYPATLSPATYYGTVSVYQAGSSGPSTQIPVTLIVNSGSQLVASPTSLTFNYSSGGATPPSQYISVSSTGSPIAFSGIVSGLSWVTLSPGTGTTPTALTVSIKPPAGLAAGTYNATALLTPISGGSSASVGITINVTSPNFISLSQSSVSFDYTIGGPTPAAEFVYVTSSGGSTRFDALASATGFGPWLKASQSSQYTPATVTITANPQGLAAGTYTGAVSIVADGANNSPQIINVTLIVTNSTTFSSNPFGMSFSYQIGQADPPYQLGVISSQGKVLPFSLSASTSSGGAWLLAAGGGTTPAAVIASISPNALTPGSYSGMLNVQPADSTLVPLQVPVLLNVASGPVFMTSANQLSFQYQLNAAAPQTQTVNVTASGGAVIVYYPAAKTADGGTWLQVSPSAGATPSAVTVTINPTGLAAGWYYGAVILNDAAGIAPVAYVPVTLQVSSGPILTVAQQPLTFTAKAGGTPPPVQQITVGGGGNTLPYHVDTSGGSWLQVTPTDGSTDAVLSVVANPAGINPGYYVGVITISIPGVAGSQQYVPVAFVAQ
jgi:hypothetical protein